MIELKKNEALELIESVTDVIDGTSEETHRKEAYKQLKYWADKLNRKVNNALSINDMANKSDRDMMIYWLESEQNQGTFKGLIEENINFHERSDSELEWLFMKWYFPMLEEEADFSMIEDYRDVLDEKTRILNKIYRDKREKQ